MEFCQVHNQEFKQIPAGISKKTGRPYNAFFVCPVAPCKEKPPKHTVPLDESEPLDKAISTNRSIDESYTKARTSAAKDEAPDWDKIAEGKVRHGIMVAHITRGDKLTDKLKEEMEEEVDYVMWGPDGKED